MNQQANAMLEELAEEKENLLKTVNESKEIIQLHEGIVKEAQQKLVELETGMQFIRKRFLHETPEKLTEEGKISVTAEQVKRSIIGTTLEDAVKSVLDNEPDKKFTVRWVKEILEAKEYPTRSKSFIDVVANVLRYLSRDGKVGFEKKGKYVTYYSLLEKENPAIFHPKPLPKVKGGIYNRNLLTEK
jgi:hypothetical protein